MAVESDIVGYSQSGLRNNATMLTPQFINIGTTVSNDIQKIIPTGDDTADNVSLQILNAYGQTTVTYNWKNGEDLDVPVEGFCWANEDNEYKVTDVMFAPGQGLWVFGSSTSQGLQSSGQVGKDDVSLRLRNNATGCGNPFPTRIDIQEILPEGPDCADNVVIQKLNAYGQTTVTYNWKNGEDLDTPVVGYCWANEDNEYKLTNVFIEPGEGLWVYGSSTDQYLTFTAPEL